MAFTPSILRVAKATGETERRTIPYGEEVNRMRYEKPEVIQLAPAINAVRNSQTKEEQIVSDGSELATLSAYSADE